MKRKSKFYYNNIFLYSSLQFIGNIEEYFTMHTEKLVVFVVMPRQQYRSSLLRLYRRGKLVEERQIILSKNIFIYYFLWYAYYLSFLLKYFSRKEKISVITFHPISFFGMAIQKMVRNIEYVYWVGDYFPPVNRILILFEKLKKHYHDKVQYACYLSDLINKKMNKNLNNSTNKKTVMWGVLPKNIKRNVNQKKFTVLFVGVIKDSQGLEFLFEFLKSHTDCYANIIGMCTGDLYKKYKTLIRVSKIEKQVFFPNKFFSDRELEELSKTCQIGIAVYDVDDTSATYYTDPGKVKTYASLGLPIVMSDVSAIVPYIKRFNCGRVIKKNNAELGEALLAIKKNYKKYQDGLKKFNTYFYYDTYYKKAFHFLESNETKK